MYPCSEPLHTHTHCGLLPSATNQSVAMTTLAVDLPAPPREAGTLLSPPHCVSSARHKV